MKIYNTLTRRKEELAPLTPGEVRMYVCGITAYDLCHIGHARYAVAFDVIRRYLGFRGYRVRFVSNFTDIDDRIIRRAQAAGVEAREISERYIATYREDMAALGVAPADVEPKATEHVPEMIALIERLLARGVAYVVDGDVYFEVRRFAAYGRLSGKNLDELLAGARVEVDERKRDPRDFALWKAAKPGEPSWPSPWGSGRPGWHIECSAMSMRYLGESFDVHGGGQDLIFPHHECEIAQSEAATGRPFVRLWIHNGFVKIGAEKMSKSLGNVLTIKELVTRHQPSALRRWLLGTHYRHPAEFAEDRMQQAARALERMWAPVRQLRPPAAGGTAGQANAGDLPAPFAALRERFIAAMDDDFNTPQALAVLADFSSALGQGADRGPAAVRAGRELTTLAGVLGLVQPPLRESLPPEAEALLAERAEARRRRDWPRADEIRAELDRRGWIVEDTADGPRVKDKGPVAP